MTPSPRERLIAAGFAPCVRCVWAFDEVEQPCERHRQAHANAAEQHVQKLNMIVRQRRRLLTAVRRVA